MKTFFTLVFAMLFLQGHTQNDISGIWRGSFVDADNKMMDPYNLEDRYKYEVQIDLQNKTFTGVTYSYKTTEFYAKASSSGTFNAKTGKVVLQELSLLELKMTNSSVACWMICFLQYSKNGNEEFLEGKYTSYRETDSAFCGRGTVFLRKVVTSDFHKEPFLTKRENQKKLEAEKKSTTPTLPPPTAPIAKRKIVPPTKRPVVELPAAPPTTTNNKPVTTKTVKKADPKAAPPTTKVETDKKATPVKPKETVVIPPILKSRQNEVIQSIVVNTNEITLKIYDNGTIDHDTVSVYLDKKLVVNKQMLTINPIVLKLKMDESADYHELVMVADNLGDIPPNTSLMVVNTGTKQYEVRITSTEQKNAMVIFKYEKPK